MTLASYLAYAYEYGSDYESGISWIQIFVYVLILVLAFGILFLRFYIPFKMAKNRGRDGVVWGVISFFLIGLIITVIILAIAGDSPEKTIQKYKEQQGDYKY